MCVHIWQGRSLKGQITPQVLPSKFYLLFTYHHQIICHHTSWFTDNAVNKPQTNKNFITVFSETYQNFYFQHYLKRLLSFANVLVLDAWWFQVWRQTFHYRHPHCYWWVPHPAGLFSVVRSVSLQVPQYTVLSVPLADVKAVDSNGGFVTSWETLAEQVAYSGHGPTQMISVAHHDQSVQC